MNPNLILLLWGLLPLVIFWLGVLNSTLDDWAHEIPGAGFIVMIIAIGGHLYCGGVIIKALIQAFS